jgi:Flp pilus assembly pilin Flp
VGAQWFNQILLLKSVNWGSTENFVFTPNAGYSISDVTVNGTSLGALTSLSLSITGPTSINMIFAINTFTLTITQTANGVISPGSSSVNYGDTPTFSITPNVGYHIVSIYASGQLVAVTNSAGQSYQFRAISSDSSLSATYASNTYTLTVTQTVNGAISPGTSTANYGDTQSFTITPSTGYHIASITVNGNAVTVASPLGQTYQFSAVFADSSLTATFAVNAYSLTVNVGGNGQSSIASQTVNWGSIETFVFTPNAGYSVADVVVNGSIDEGSVSSLSLTVTGDTSVDVSFAINSFTITVTQGANGQIAPATANVNLGDNQTFTIMPDTGYYLASLTVDGSPVTVAALYTFSNVDASHTITATFVATATPTPTPVPTPTPTPTFVQATTENGGTVDLPISGNITSPQISNVTITTSQSVKTTTVSFTVTGESGTTGFSNITIPISEIPYGTAPTVYIDGQYASNQGFKQDNSNYYVWYTTHFSTHQITIVYSWAILQVVISGNITSSKITTGKIPATELISTTNSTTTITFHISWENGTTAFSNITIPKSEVPYGTIPTIYLDHQVPNQGYTQDANNYYVWCTTPLNMDEISETASIMFVTPSQSPTASPNQSKSPFQALPVDAIYGLIAVAVAVAVVAVLMSPKIGLSKKLKQKVEKLHKATIRLHSF